MFGGDIPPSLSTFEGSEDSSRTLQCLKMKAVRYCNVSGIKPTTQHNNPEDLKSQITMLRRPELFRT